MFELGLRNREQIMRLFIVKGCILEHDLSAIVGRLLINKQYYTFHINLITETLTPDYN